MREIYTPTTDEVRESYADILISTGPNTFELIDPDKAHAEFDRWLFAERQRVAELAMEKERERIIKKLLSSLIEFQYFNGLTSHRIDPNEHTKDEAEAILRNIIKED